MPGKIADQAKKNLQGIKDAKAKGSLGPFKGERPSATTVSRIADRKSQEKELGYSKKGYTGD